jgi:hypothetical protein
MKKIILSITVILLIVVGTAFAFKSPTTTAPSKFVTKNFVYEAYPNDDPSELDDPLNYTLTGTGGTDPLNCPTGSHRCGVIAMDDGTGHPDFSQTYTIKTKN